MRGQDHICAAHAICFQCFKEGAERTRARREAYAQRSLPFDQVLPEQSLLSTREFARLVGIKPEAKFVIAFGYDHGWTTNLPLEYFLAEDSLFAWSHDGQPIPLEHGGPVRLIVPQLYAWKSAKWIKGVRLLERDEPGFWEEGGYHMRGNPWQGRDGERFRWGE
jgi:DMSO/TMAO reductase YedYZ molybdopterin-dependent catalytic subunit